MNQEISLSDNGGSLVKPALSFYTNMPTPYQLDFFDALTEWFSLTVIYYSLKEHDRQWSLPASSGSYKVVILKDNLVARLVQKKVSSFHLANNIKQVIAADQSRYVVVNGTYWSPNVVLAILHNYRRNKDVFFWTEPVFPVYNKTKRWLKRVFMWPVLNKTTALLAIGRAAEDSFRSFGYKKPVYQLPYNINHKLFQKGNLDKEQLQTLHRKFKSQGEFIFLTSGSLIRRKGIDTLVKAFKKLDPSSKARLLIIGDGDERTSLDTLAKDCPGITFLGFQDKSMIPYWFNLADAFVFASRYDGWGLIINEAIAASLPVICSRQTGAAVDKLSNGLAILLDSEDVEGFYEAMKDMMTGKLNRQEIISRTNQIAEEFSSEYNARQLYNICTAAE